MQPPFVVDSLVPIPDGHDLEDRSLVPAQSNTTVRPLCTITFR